MVLKPSPETPLSVLSLALLAEEAGFEKGTLNVVTTSLENTPAVSEALCRHPLVKKVTFTGSVSFHLLAQLFLIIARAGLTEVDTRRKALSQDMCGRTQEINT
jgi:delta 1-pyrroline-5-carboxylate dehydrogenase